MSVFRYAIDLTWSSEDGGYIATVPELPGVSAFGETADVAVREVEVAAAAMVDVLEGAGSPVPVPLSLPSFSGQFRVRLPVSLHRTLAARARRERVSLNTLVVALLAEGLGAGEDRSCLGRVGLDQGAGERRGVPR